MPPRPTLKKSLRAIERAFADIESRLDRLAERVRAAEQTPRRRAHMFADHWEPVREVKLTAKRRAQLKLQGAYMGFMRQLGPRQQARVRAVKEKQGFEAAIRVARVWAARSR